jgi:hypothetical protein
MTEPYLTIHKQNILKFVNKAARGITDDTLRLLTNDSSKDCNAKEIIHLLTEQNGSYPFEINGEKYLRYTAFGNMMYIFKFGKQKDDNSKYLFIRMNDSLNNCIYMIDNKTKQIVCCYDKEFDETIIFPYILTAFPDTTSSYDFNKNIIIKISLDESAAIGIESVLRPYRVLCKLDS